MNPGTFQGAGTGSPLGTISRYIQTPTISTSQTIAVPPGTQRIEALLCGGGGGGGSGPGGGGGFGGCAIIEVPVTGQPLQIVIGAGGASNTAGSPTYIVSAGTRYAEVGGGGYGSPSSFAGGSGRSGGGGGGDSFGYGGGNGGAPPIGKLLWSIYPQFGAGGGSNDAYYPTMSYYESTTPQYFTWTRAAPSGAGIGGGNNVYTAYGCYGLNGSFGGGGGGAGVQHWNGAGFAGTPGYGGGGARYSGGGTGGSYGGGGGYQAAGGSLTAVTIWGYTGFAGGTAAGNGGGGGGGMLGAGANSGSSAGANGGNGGGGGGGGSPGGTGGNGFAAIRFYL